MSMLRLCKKILCAAVALCVPSLALAGDSSGSAPASAPASCGTIRVCEMVPVHEVVDRITYKTEQRVENYTVYKTEYVQEQKTATYTTYRHETYTVMEPRTVCVKVPVIEERVEMVSKLVRKQVTEMRTKTVDQGHWECREVPKLLGNLFKDPCDPCPATRIKKVWVPCKVTVCEPVTTCKWVRECVPVCKKVCTYRTETRTEMVPVCKTRCVPEVKTCTYTVCKPVCKPVVCTRTVNVCVPVTEKVTVCKMVPRWVEKPAPATTDACCNPCVPCCVPVCKKICCK